MKKNNFFLLLFFIVLLIGCSKEKIIENKINEKSLDLQILEAYSEGMKNLEDGDVLFAAKKFNEAEILFPQSIWAPRSALMAAYSYYTQDYYSDVVSELTRFIRVYPNHENLDYAYYLLAVSYYEQIVDEKKDLDSINKSKKNFEIVVKEFPNTEYALDSEFKLDLIDDILASKEMYIGRYYFKRKKWISAINRFRNVIDDYDTTIYTPEALHRLVEIYYIIGLRSESEKYANILGYNYQSSDWYKNSYSLFNKNYKKIKKNRDKRKDKSKTILNKIKSILD
tara:strand:+ start:108 stop:953 length:846 start_codon:yes stop_codon:yes gene_type:complete